jgi:hypothetical protein
MQAHPALLHHPQGLPSTTSQEKRRQNEMQVGL